MKMEGKYLFEITDPESKNYFKKWLPINDDDREQLKEQKEIIHQFVNRYTWCTTPHINLKY